jgi:hypothetical protein
MLQHHLANREDAIQTTDGLRSLWGGGSIVRTCWGSFLPKTAPVTVCATVVGGEHGTLALILIAVRGLALLFYLASKIQSLEEGFLAIFKVRMSIGVTL